MTTRRSTAAAANANASAAIALTAAPGLSVAPVGISRAQGARPAARALASAPSLAEQAYVDVKQLIFDFTLMPGARFSETELVQRLAVSRTPLRQALQRLQREGFLEVFPKLGWQVAALDFDTFDELYDLRVLLECQAVQRLCDAEPRDDLQALAAIWSVEPAERLADGEAVSHLDEAFHQQLVRSSGNRQMARVHADITERIRIIRRLDFTKTERMNATYDEHARILRAITRRRTDEAQRLLRAHIEQSKLEVRHITLDMLYRARRGA